ncbi:holin [Mycobacterium phage Steamy]|uniref:Holin n=1 Tax=Mycobacterium phage Steamy TaxID=2250309 RepID=A0A345L0I5_9CAUD|nr:holin [Mycobacterium phage Steamy]AXH48787.1 holin [Mycobacterium phage Steamy]
MSPKIYAKAIFAGLVAIISAASLKAGGPDLSVLTAGDWLAVIGAGLVTGTGTFAVPNKSTEPSLSPTEAVVSGVQQVIAARATAQAELDKVTSVLGDIAGQIPVYGDEAKAIVNALPKF